MAVLFVYAVMFLSQIIGMALLCVGILPASAWAMMVYGHILWQLYELYLARGGEPIPAKDRRALKPRHGSPELCGMKPRRGALRRSEGCSERERC